MADYTRDITMNVTANTKQAEESLARLKGATEQAGQALDKKKESAVNAGGAVMSFGRIIQDAPFGIIGVANNITMLSEQFVYLKAQTGSTTGALQAMKAAVFGPMGISIAISAITTGLMLWQMHSQKAEGATKKAVDKIKELTEGAKIYNAVQKDGVSEGLAQISNLQKLAKEYDNAATSVERKKKIIETLKSLHPDVIKTLNEQTAKEKSLSEAIKDTTGSIYRKVKAQLIDSQLAPEYAKINKAFGRRIQVENEYDAERQRLWGKLGKGASTESINQIMQAQGWMAKLTDAQLEFDIALSGFDKARDKANATAELAMSRFTSGITSGVGTYGEFGDSVLSGKSSINKAKDKVETVKTFFQSLKEEIQTTLEIDNLLERKTGKSVYESYLKLIGDEISSGKASQSEMLEWLRLRKDVLKAMESDFGDNGLMEIGNGWFGKKNAKTGWGGLESFLSSNKQRDKELKEAAKEKLKAEKEAAKKQFETYKNYFIDPFTDAFKGEFSKAWQSIFGEANSLLEKFIQSLGEKLFNAGIEKAAYGLMDLIFPGSGALGGAISGGGADSRTVNQIIIDGELIATQKQANRIKAQLDRQAALR